MQHFHHILRRLGNKLEHQRLCLARREALLSLAMLGLISGLLAGAVIIAFRLLIESVQADFLPDGNVENYEALPPLSRLLLATLGGLLIGALFQVLLPRQRQVGVVHVMERLAYHQGHLPWQNLLAQFFGAALSVISGHSVGREGPSIHLGAGNGSLLGQLLKLPNNTVRTLVGCGTAAAIAASFNTPLAGVVLAMEVIMLEYSIAGFMPVILAAVSATTLTRFVFGSEPAFTVPTLEFVSLGEMGFILFMGIVLGGLAAAFVWLTRRITEKTAQHPLWLRLTLAGFITGLCAWWVPAVMGIGYDSVNAALLGQFGIGSLLALAVFKLLATTAGIGLGLPGGLIGPTLVIGAAAGGAMGLLAGMLAATFTLGPVSPPGFYAMLGMGAMMGATLQAPLAALTALLELTYNPNIILPGMLALIAAGLTSSQLFKQDSVFMALLRSRGLDYRNDPISQSLRSQGVTSMMCRQFVRRPQTIRRDEAMALLAEAPEWIVVDVDGQPKSLLPAADLRHALEQRHSNDFDLLEIPGRRLQLARITLQSNLQAAYEALRQGPGEALYVTRITAPGIERIYGILTLERIEASYHS